MSFRQAQIGPRPLPFSSPLLANHISSITLAIPPIEATSLIEPILVRRDQLLSNSLPRLQVSASRAMLSTYTSGLAGVLVSWIWAVPPIALLSAPTGTGLGILSVVASVALGQRLWRRAQVRFWRDWDRIAAMLKEDLSVSLPRQQR